MNVSIPDFWPQLVDQAKVLHGAFATIAMVLVFVGIVSRAVAGAYGEVSHSLKGVASAAIVTVAIFALPDWMDQIQLLSHGLVQELNADPAKSHERFAMLIAGPETASADAPGFWDVMFDDQGGIGKAVLYAIVLLMGKVALAVMWIAFVVQQLVLIFSIGISPVFLAMLLLGATREVGVKFLLTLTGVATWPLGWAMADKLTSALLKLAASPETYDPAGGNAALEASQGFFIIVILSLWMLASTIAAPYAIYKVLQTGGQIGASLLGSVAGSVSQGGSYALGAGVTASMSGTSSGVAVAAAGAAGRAAAAVMRTGLRPKGSSARRGPAALRSGLVEPRRARSRRRL